VGSYNNYVQEDKKFKNGNVLPNDSKDSSKKNNSHKSFEEMKKAWRKYCEYWKSYPDRFIDAIKPHDCKIDLYPYQRIWLRILFRYQKVYITATRGTAKSFTEILALYLRCIMFPGLKLFISAPG
jgi:reverse gyrase